MLAALFTLASLLHTTPAKADSALDGGRCTASFLHQDRVAGGHEPNGHPSGLGHGVVIAGCAAAGCGLCAVTPDHAVVEPRLCPAIGPLPVTPVVSRSTAPLLRPPTLHA